MKMAQTELRTEIEIAATPERVFQVLTDFARYPEWNPFITHISGELRVGLPLQIELSLPEKNKTYRFAPQLVRFETNQELRWRGRFLLPGLFDGEHFFQITPKGDKSVRFVHGEDFRGL